MAFQRRDRSMISVLYKQQKHTSHKRIQTFCIGELNEYVAKCFITLFSKFKYKNYHVYVLI